MKCPICTAVMPEMTKPDHSDVGMWLFSTDCEVCGTNVMVTIQFRGEAPK